MFSKLTKFYMSKNRRERIMLALIFLAIALFWATELSESSSNLSEQIEIKSKKVETLQSVISQGPAIQDDLEKIRSVFDTRKTIAAPDLQLIVENCAKDAGLIYSMSAATTKETDKFKVHSINLSAQKSKLAELSNFETQMRKREPYITILRTVFDGASDGTVDARYTINSFSSK